VACKTIAAIKKRDHIFLVKRLVAGVTEVGRNARKIEINPVASGGGPSEPRQSKSHETDNPANLSKHGGRFAARRPVSGSGQLLPQRMLR
jgi:hypothetical protein